MELFTLGVYGLSENEFFEKIISAGIDTFVDVRLRRGMRGAKYSFVNSIYLQRKLESLEVSYIHAKGLAPTRQIRSLQASADKEAGETKRERGKLSAVFCDEYREGILDVFDFADLTALISQGRVCLFCVESNCNSCHRSLISDYLSEKFKDISVVHL